MKSNDIKEIISMSPIILICGLKFIAIPGVICMMILPFSPETSWPAILTAFLYSIPVFWFGGIYIGLRHCYKSEESKN
jgi:ABC-type dipeptide/oligopeptide/nickel transport system permease component